MRKYVKDEQIQWRDVAESGPPLPGVTDQMRDGITYRRLSEGDGFWVSDSRMPAGKVAPIHSHSEGEYSYILEGSCTMDDGTELVAGDSFVMTKDQYYGFTVGPNGLRFLAIRPAEAAIHMAVEDDLAATNAAERG